MMFGSSFFQNFGLPDFPFQGMDPQGGMFGGNIDPTASQTPQAGGAAAPAGGIAAPQAAPSGSGAPSPLAPSPLAPPTPPRMSDPGPAAGNPPSMLNDTGQPMSAPAAGISSPFGRPQL